MYVKRLSENKLYPPFASGGLWRTWCLFLFSGIRHYPPKHYGGANHIASKDLTNIRRLTAKRESGIVIHSGVQKKISKN